MARDLDIKLQQDSDQIYLSKVDCISPIAREAITILLFTNIPELRIFDGGSLFTALPKITSGNINYLFTQLALLNYAFKSYFLASREDVEDVTINAEIIDEHRLDVTIDITTTDAVTSDVIYTTSLL